MWLQRWQCSSKTNLFIGSTWRAFLLNVSVFSRSASTGLFSYSSLSLSFSLFLSAFQPCLLSLSLSLSLSLTLEVVMRHRALKTARQGKQTQVMDSLSLSRHTPHHNCLHCLSSPEHLPTHNHGNISSLSTTTTTTTTTSSSSASSSSFSCNLFQSSDNRVNRFSFFLLSPPLNWPFLCQQSGELASLVLESHTHTRAHRA